LSVTLTNLSENVSLVGLLGHGSLSFLFCISDVLKLDLLVKFLLFVVFNPVSFVSLCFLELDIDFTMLVNILEQINAGLVFSAPLSFSLTLDFLTLDLSQIFNHLFILGF
jgi:hypothetical protein